MARHRDGLEREGAGGGCELQRHRGVRGADDFERIQREDRAGAGRCRDGERPRSQNGPGTGRAIAQIDLHARYRGQCRVTRKNSAD